jgi:CRP/FNR family transcriptional regulator
VAYCLLKLVSIFGYDKSGSGKLEYTLSRKDISIICNTTYESVIRTLSAFEKEQVIESEGKAIIIRNEEHLRGIALGTVEIKTN